MSSHFFCFLTAFSEDLIHRRNILLELFSPGPYRLQLCLEDIVQESFYLHVSQTAPLIVGFQLIQIIILRHEFREVLRSAECIQIGKYCISFQTARIFNADMVRVSKHTEDLFLNILRFF